jgi:hypothetical protein
MYDAEVRQDIVMRQIGHASTEISQGGWGSNPRPADYENYGPVHRLR